MTSSFQYIAKQKNINYTITIAQISNAWFDRDVIEKTITVVVNPALNITINSPII
jgi:hypothetical protein